MSALHCHDYYSCRVSHTDRYFVIYKIALDILLLLLLLSHFSRVRLCATPWQPTRLLCPWDSPGKNIGVGCHFLLQSMHACMLSCFSRVRLCVTPWTAAHQAPLSMGLPRQEYWSGLPFPSTSHRALVLKLQLPRQLVKTLISGSHPQSF